VSDEYSDDHPERLLTIPEVAVKLGVSVPTTRRYLVGKDALPSFKLNIPKGARRVRLGDLEEWTRKQNVVLLGPDDPPRSECREEEEL
jgi:predicted DNA-binding transcriptional regulator AlpA